MLKLLSEAGDIAALASDPLLIIPFLLVLWVFKMITRNATGWQITLSGFQGKIVIGLLALATIAYGIDIADRLGGIYYLQAQMKPVEFHDQHFENQRVQLTGNSYRHCTFTNVTFVFDGKPGPIIFSDNIIKGYAISSDDAGIERTLYLLIRMGAINIQYVDKDGTKTEPGSGATMRPPF